MTAQRFAIRSRVVTPSGAVEIDYQTGFTGTRRACRQRIHDDFIEWSANRLGDSPCHDESFDSWRYCHCSGKTHIEYVAYSAEALTAEKARRLLTRELRRVLPKVGSRAVRGHSVHVAVTLESGWHIIEIERSNHGDQSEFLFLGTHNVMTDEWFHDGYHCIASMDALTVNDLLNIYYKTLQL